ncbi:MAG: hypothetical protein MR615_00245 [Prevotella sp.]|nr:hypothetical protein [Prevotella sp.]
MDRQFFADFLHSHKDIISTIRERACALHASVNQIYGDKLPYGYHLCQVADAAMKYGHHVTAVEEDILPIVFGAYFHDSIEDARLTYNDLLKIASGMLSRSQALMATESAYALTNEKGRNRAERANERYYSGIRSTPYAPFVKLCDRYANISYSCNGKNDTRMRMIYQKEWNHFIEAITSNSTDVRLQLPEDLKENTTMMLSQK